MHVGEKLRQARVAQGLEISGIAAQLKIQPRYLAAIEAAQRDKLPSAFLFRSWVRQYADALGLDYAEIQADLDELLCSDGPLPLPGQGPWTSGSPTGYPSLQRRSGVYRLASSLAMLAVVIAGGSALYAHRGSFLAQLRQWPGSVQANAKQTSAPMVARPIERPADPPVPAVLLELYAREQTWISISPDGKEVFSGLLLANQSRSVRAEQSALLKIGNAGGLDVRFNGNPVGEIGPHGRTRVLFASPGGVKILPTARTSL